MFHTNTLIVAMQRLNLISNKRYYLHRF